MRTKLCFFLAAVLGYSSAAGGFNNLFQTGASAIGKGVQKLASTKSPRHVYKGPHPSVDPIGRGGMWNVHAYATYLAAQDFEHTHVRIPASRYIAAASLFLSLHQPNAVTTSESAPVVTSGGTALTSGVTTGSTNGCTPDTLDQCTMTATTTASTNSTTASTTGTTSTTSSTTTSTTSTASTTSSASTTTTSVTGSTNAFTTGTDPVGTDAGGSTGGGGTSGGGGAAPAAGGQRWENWGPGGGSDGAPGAVNTNTGNRLTSVPIVGWSGPGKSGIDLTLFHNSEGTNLDRTPAKWRTSYDISIYEDLSQPATVSSPRYALLTWGNGTTVPYRTFNGTMYQAPPGIYEQFVRDASGYRITTKDQTVFSFTPQGNLSKITDRLGHYVSISTWTQQWSRYLLVTDENGRWVRFSSGATIPGGVTAFDGRVWTFQGTSTLLGISYPTLSGTTYTRSFIYNAGGDILSETDLRGKVHTFSYDASNRLTSFQDPLNHQVNYTYGGSSTSYSLPTGGSVTHNYSGGAFVSEVDPLGYSNGFGYDANFNVTYYQDKRGYHTYSTYDARGNLTTSDDYAVPASAPHQKVYTYNATNDLLTYKNPVQETTTYTYDSLGNLTAVHDSSNVLQLSAQYTDGRPTTVTTPDGMVSSTYDGYGNLVLVTKDGARTTTYQRDTIGRVTSITDYLGNVTSMTYDEWGRPTLYDTPTGQMTVGYDGEGNILALRDQLSRWTTFFYSDDGQLTTKINARNDVEHYTYDDSDRITGVQNGRGYWRLYGYNTRGDVTTLTLPDSTSEGYAYDEEGNLSTLTRADGAQISYVYDRHGNLTSVAYPGGTSTTFEYDDADRRTKMFDSTGTSSINYAHGQLLSYFTPQGNTIYEFDAQNRVSAMREEAPGYNARTVYTRLGSRLTSLTKTPDNETTSWSYDAYLRPQRQTFANGMTADYGYDTLGRLASITHKKADGSVITAESYAYNAVGNLTSKTVDGVTTAYGYDPVDQLTSETRPGYAANYTYDGNGNRTSKTLNGSTETYVCDPADKLTSVSSGGATTKLFGYDARGRTTSVWTPSGTTTLTYDHEDRLTSIVQPGFWSSSFTYNGLDARVSKSGPTGSATVYRRAGIDPTSELLGEGVTTHVPGISARAAGTTAFTLADRLGTTVAQANASAGTTASASYDAFGLPQASTGTSIGSPGYVGGWGYQEDSEWGLKLVGHRYYDPASARFVTSDPIGSGSNWYAYCDNRPTSEIDAAGYLGTSVEDPRPLASAERQMLAKGAQKGMRAYRQLIDIFRKPIVRFLAMFGLAAEPEEESVVEQTEAAIARHTERLFQVGHQVAEDIPGSGPVTGTLRHSAARDILRQEQGFGNLEQSWLNGEQRSGPGSIRIDGAIVDSGGRILKIFDFKFGSARLTDSRIQEILRHLPDDWGLTPDDFIPVNIPNHASAQAP